MYFTHTPSLNSMEAIMQRPPGGSQRGGGRNRSPYKYTKKDCDCRFCLYYRKKNGCTIPICPVLDIRLSCGAASLSEAVKATFTEVKHIPFQRRLSKIYSRKDDEHMIFQNEAHKRIFDSRRMNLHKPSNRTLAVLYLLTADHILWIRTKRHIERNGKVDLQSVQLGDISTDGYALWKAVKELQTGERQISLCELSDSDVISDRAFRLIVQATTIARFGAAVLNESEVYGKKYCHHSPTMEEVSLQEAIMNTVLKTAQVNPDILQTLKLHIQMGLGAESGEDESVEVQIRIAQIDKEFKDILNSVTAENQQQLLTDPRITELMAEKRQLENKLAEYSAAEQHRKNAASRLDNIFTVLDGMKNHPLTYDDQVIRQILQCVVVESKEKIRVIFVGGLEVTEKLS